MSEKSFIYNDSSKEQQSIHNEKMILVRDACSLNYSSHDLPNDTESTPFKCDVCSKSFSHKEYLERHFSTHSQEKQFNCDVCSKSFSRKDHLD